MPDGARGRTNGVDVIWLNKGQQQVERRCALAHELVHLEREHRGCQPLSIEADVCEETARRLIPMDLLSKGLRWARSFDELADELWVTPDVLRDRLTGLADAEWETLLTLELQPL
ncbi:ImmA/IrrE family metallo-endopeptidase [Paenarthrobacter ureafaciens]|uniref:ImmA/IrrE family metallo-endopeptidase n=2 Tax=Paenarthrobacter TaxID=1742992 RepID=UPI001F624CEB|nr:ImmA/IrrE family metallo-endopeptidase [Paenarthrobacter ureafaciens]